MNLRVVLITGLIWVALNTGAFAEVQIGYESGFKLDQTFPKHASNFSAKDFKYDYLLQQSADLIHWTDVAIIEARAEEVNRWDFDVPSSQPFTRLLLPNDFAESLPDDDSNGDRASDCKEIWQGNDLFSATVDTNGLPTEWEKFFGIPAGTPINTLAPRNDGLSYLQAFQQRLNPMDYYDGKLPILTVTSGDKQIGPPDGIAPQALVVEVKDGNGMPLINAPIKFQTMVGQFQASCSATPATLVLVYTNDAGQARMFFQTPAETNTVCTVIALVTTQNRMASAVFTINSDDGKGKYPNPFSPTNCFAQGNPDGSADITWENHSEDETPIEISFEKADGSWRLVATLPPGTTSYHWTPSQRYENK